MTRMEKENIMSALRQYADTCAKKAEKEMNRGEAGRAASLRAEAAMAESNLSTFAFLLTVPCGEAKI